MKKSIKNTIMIGMAAVLIGTSAVTISYAKDGKGANEFAPPAFSQQFDGEQSGKPFGNFDSDKSKQNGGFDKNKMPDNQQNGGNSQQPQPPSNQQNGSNSQQPQAPQSSNDSSTESNSESSSSATNTSLSVEAFAAEDSSAQTAQKNLPSNNFRGGNIGVIQALCYMFAALQIAIILAILAYLIISKFNDVSFNEVLANMKKSNSQPENP